MWREPARAGASGCRGFPGRRESGRSSERSSAAGALVLSASVAVRQVAARDDELGIDLGDEGAESVLDLRLLRVPACRSETWRTRTGHIWVETTMWAWPTNPNELFDDIYVGLRAGAAGRKKRRGEPLSAGGDATRSAAGSA